MQGFAFLEDQISVLQQSLDAVTEEKMEGEQREVSLQSSVTSTLQQLIAVREELHQANMELQVSTPLLATTNAAFKVYDACKPSAVLFVNQSCMQKFRCCCCVLSSFAMTSSDALASTACWCST